MYVYTRQLVCPCSCLYPFVVCDQRYRYEMTNTSTGTPPESSQLPLHTISTPLLSDSAFGSVRGPVTEILSAGPCKQVPSQNFTCARS